MTLFDDHGNSWGWADDWRADSENLFDFVDDEGRVLFTDRFGVIEERDKAILAETDGGMEWLPKSVLLASGDEYEAACERWNFRPGAFVKPWFVRENALTRRFRIRRVENIDIPSRPPWSP